MNGVRGLSVTRALAIGLMALPAVSRADPVPLPPGASRPAVAEPAVAGGMVAVAVTESIPTLQRLGTITSPSRQGTLPIVMARGVLSGGASLAGGARGYASRAIGLIRLGLAPRMTLEARTGFLALDRAAAYERRLTRSEARLRYGGAGRGAWLGAAFERSLARAREPSAVELGLGAWAAPGEVALAFSLEQTNEYARIATVLPPERRSPEQVADTLADPVRVVFDERLVRATSALVSGRWEHRRLGVESVAGVTLNRRFTPRRWMQASFDVAVRPRLAVYATLGNPAPRWFSLEPGLERGATLGLKLTSAVNAAAAGAAEAGPKAPEFRLRHLGEDWYVIEVRARAAGPVEVIGDFSGWEPRALRHVTGRRWALAMRVAPGVHQIQVRVDGGPWSPPAGLPTASDGFNGDVGVFVAR